MSEIRNARIKSTSLGLEGHGIFSANLQLEYDGSGQSFGGYALDQYNKTTKDREGTAYGMEFIRRIMEVVGVESWEELPSKYIRVDSDHSKVWAIGHITRDKWFRPEEDMGAFL